MRGTAYATRRSMLPNTRAVWLATVVQCVTGGLGVTLIPQTAPPSRPREAGWNSPDSSPLPGATNRFGV